MVPVDVLVGVVNIHRERCHLRKEYGIVYSEYSV
jgi:hypothetical protein